MRVNDQIGFQIPKAFILGLLKKTPHGRISIIWHFEAVCVQSWMCYFSGKDLRQADIFL